MKKILLTTTLIAVTTVSANAWSFGGLGILGHKSSHKAGVNAIGVHIDANNTQKPNIEIVDTGDSQEPTCPEHSAWNDETSKCECDTWYEKNEETGVCEETCPADKQCGDTCCGEGHTCQEGQCCDENGHCCASSGYSTETGECCDADSVVYYQRDEGTRCCPNTYTLTHLDFVDGGSSYCCENGIAYQDNIGDVLCCPEGSQVFPMGESSDGFIYSVCCEEGIAYCTYKEDGYCEETACCTGTVSKGTGENSADECLE